MPPMPTRLLHAEFASLDAMCAAVRAWDLDFQPLETSSFAGPVAEVEQWEVARFRCDFATIRTRMHQRGSAPPGRYTFALLDPCVQNIWWRGSDVDAAHVLVYTPGCEVDCVAGLDFKTQVLSLERDTIEEIAERAGRRLPKLSRLPYAFSPPSDFLRRARAGLSRIRYGVDTDPSDVAETLVLSWISRAGIGVREKRETASDRSIKHCLEAGVDGPADIGMICRTAGVSRRTLEVAFRARFDMGPAAFLKRRRMAEVRRMLLRASPGETRVADEMDAMGFSHVGQFASDYRRLFGELPSETLSRT